MHLLFTHKQFHTQNCFHGIANQPALLVTVYMEGPWGWCAFYLKSFKVVGLNNTDLWVGINVILVLQSDVLAKNALHPLLRTIAGKALTRFYH